MMADQKHEYLGDGVHASFDGWHIWLRTGGHGSDENKIALDPTVFSALLQYRERVFKSHNMSRGGEPEDE